ncbi:MAG: TfoX/Sxy family protein [Undibacterium umbellatum]|uniref:TfoX/Sxy family protein n=1 Tax=Undibacterium umbellatum TaxID=2762300 RepID=UPI003BB7FACB
MFENGAIAAQKGLGPKSAMMLAQVGITTMEQLQELGSVGAFLLVRQNDSRASLNLLWGLESALTGMPWQEISRFHRSSLLLALDSQANQNKSSDIK